MGMTKLPIAATSIVCSACVAVSVAAPTVDLPEKSRQVEAARSVTQEYKLVAVTDPITGAVTLFALPLADLGQVNKFFADNLLSPLFTLASSPLNIPTQVSNQVPLDTAIQNNITVPIQKLQAFPAGLVALIQDIFGGTSMMAASGPNVALAAAPTPGLDALVSPLADLGQVNKFFADNLLSPLFTFGLQPAEHPHPAVQPEVRRRGHQSQHHRSDRQAGRLPGRTRRSGARHPRWRDRLRSGWVRRSSAIPFKHRCPRHHYQGHHQCGHGQDGPDSRIQFFNHRPSRLRERRRRTATQDSAALREPQNAFRGPDRYGSGRTP